MQNSEPNFAFNPIIFRCIYVKIAHKRGDKSMVGFQKTGRQLLDLQKKSYKKTHH